MARNIDVRKRTIRWYGGNLAVFAVGIAAVVYVCALLAMNYRSDRQLRDTAIQKLRTETDKLAESVGYFFEERKDDLINLGMSREVAVFFENRALGMSMKYGLSLSLPPIAERFSGLMERKKFAGEPVYIRIALIDKSGEFLVDSAAERPDPQLRPQYLDSSMRDGQIRFMSGDRELVAPFSYYFKGSYAGQLVAWLNPGILGAQLLGSTEKGKDVTWLTVPDAGGPKIIAPQHLAATFHKGFDPSAIGMPGLGATKLFTAPDAQGKNRDWLCIVAAVRGSNFRIVRAVQVESTFGLFMSQWHLAGMASLAVVILCGVVFTFTLNLKSQLLQARLEESLRRETEIQDKERALCEVNRELTSEIAIGEVLSTELKNSHMQLEQRVDERTAELQNSLQEKNVLLREVHHRVKNNLQVISSLLNLQSLQTKDDEAIAVLKKTKDRVYSMAMLHEALCISDNLARIKLSDYIERLSSHLINSMGSSASNIEIKSRVSEIHLQIEQAMPCGLIINELITNAIKHAFPEGRSGRIMIAVGVQADGRIGMTISDDGVGLPPNLNIQTVSSLGLKLVSMLTKQLGGELVVPQNSGTEFQIAFCAADQHAL